VKTAARSLLAVVVGLALAGCLPDAPSAPPSSALPTGGLQLLYRVPVSSNVGLVKPVANAERVVAHSNRRLEGFDRATGASMWHVDAEDQEIFGAPVIHDGRVLSAGTKVWAFSAMTGAPLWRVDIGRRADGHIAAASEGRLFVGADSSVFALDAATGALIWRTGIGDSWEFDGRVRGVSVRGEAVYVCAQEPLFWNGYRSRGNVVALNAQTGAILWRYLMFFETEYNFCSSEPLVTEHLVVLGDAGGNNIVAVQRATGEFLWRFQGEQGWVGPWDTPSLIGDSVITASSNDRHVTAFALATGLRLWRTQLDGSVWAAAPCGRVVLAHHFNLAVLDQRDGSVLARDVQRAWNDEDVLHSRFLVEGDTAFVFGREMMLKLRCPR
jgi:outer membrane protein assembly factor BamB